MRRGRRFAIVLPEELRLSRLEREAARAERRAEDLIRRERENPESPERRAAALEAEVRRYGQPRGRV